MNCNPHTLFSAAIAATALAMPCIASASDASSNPSASVPSVNYRSVFRDTSLGIEADKTDWRKANEAVGQFRRGHADILKQEESERAAASGSATPTQPATAPQSHRHPH